MNNQSILVENVPSDWVIKKIKYVFDERKETNDPIQTDVLVSLTHDRGVILHSEKGDIGNKEKDDIKKYKIVHPGDIVVNSMNVIIGSSGLSDHFGLVSPVYYMLVKKDPNHDNKFFHYLFRSIVFQKSLIGVGNGILEHRMRVPIDKLGGHLIPLPSANEQKRISKYLDQKTEQIDSLIEKIEKKIELLKEQRTSLINQCVTKGLDPNVEMKDSGIEWIGEIPSHWKIKSIKFLGERKSGDGFKVDYQGVSNGEIPFYKVSDTNLSGNEKYLYKSNNYVSRDKLKSERFRLFPKDTIVFPKIGMVLKLNKRRILTTHSCIDNNMMGFVLNTEDDLNYIFKFFTIVDFDLHCSPGTIPSISENQVGRIPILVPPIEEQKRISKYLDQKTEQIDSLVNSENNRIKLLKEYRQSLISSVVTGKVQVTEEMVIQ